METLKFYNMFHDFQHHQQFFPGCFEIKCQFRKVLQKPSSVLLTLSLYLHTRRCQALLQMANI